jgi:RNA polymerase sigma-70 factor (ECF subfamily)
MVFDGDMADKSAPSVSQVTSLTLLARARNLDREAWFRLVSLYSPLVYDWCRHQGLQSADAADVVQEVFRTVWQNIAEFRRDRPEDSFRGWLWKITRSRICDQYRAQASLPRAIGGSSAHVRWLEVAEQDPGAVPESAGNGGPLQHALEYVRAEFRDGTWEAFCRAVMTRQPTAEIAADLGISVNAVRKAKSRVLRRLREEFDDFA